MRARGAARTTTEETMLVVSEWAAGDQYGATARSLVMLHCYP